MSEMVCSFTGHRVIKNTHRNSITALILRAVSYSYDRGCRIFMSGGALGFDTLAAREVIRFKMTHPDVRLHLILPCINQDAKWNQAEINSYRFLLENADEIVYISEEYTDNCMKERNCYLAQNADIIISYVGSEISGSAQTVRMARKLQKQIYNLYPTLDKESGNI